MGLEGLDPREVTAFTLGEAILAVKLQLGCDHGVDTPAMHVQRCLRQHKCTGVRHGGARTAGIEVRGRVRSAAPASCDGVGSGSGTGHLEETTCVNVLVVTTDRLGSAERVDSVGKGVNRVGVVEGLGTQHLEQSRGGDDGVAVIDVSIGLHNPDELLHGVAEVQADLVAGRTHRLVTGVLELGDEVLMGVVGELPALISVQETVVHVQRCGDQRLVVGSRGGDGGSPCAVQRGDGPQALAEGSEIKVDLHLMVLQSNQGKRQTGVGAKPELQGNVQGRLRKRVAGSAHLGRARVRVVTADRVQIGETGVSDECKGSGVTNHLEIVALLLLGHCQLVPDVHEVTILAINLLATNLTLHLRDQLLTGEIQPAGIHRAGTTGTHLLGNRRQCDLKVRAVRQVAVTANGALNTATEISLAIESLLNRLKGKVCVTLESYLPVRNLGRTGKNDILSALCDDFH